MSGQAAHSAVVAVAESTGGQAAGTQATGVPGTIPSLVPANIILERPSTFSGKHSELKNWMHEIK